MTGSAGRHVWELLRLPRWMAAVGAGWRQPRRRGAQRRAARGLGHGAAACWARPAREERRGFIADAGRTALAGLEAGGTRAHRRTGHDSGGGGTGKWKGTRAETRAAGVPDGCAGDTACSLSVHGWSLTAGPDDHGSTRNAHAQRGGPGSRSAGDSCPGVRARAQGPARLSAVDTVRTAPAEGATGFGGGQLSGAAPPGVRTHEN